MKKFFNRTSAQILSIILAGVCVYCFMIDAPFKTLDDNVSIINNTDIQNTANIGMIFTKSFFGGNHYYRPLVSLSFMAEYYFVGLSPLLYNFNNLLLHLLIAITVYFLIYRIMKDRKSAFFCGLLFAVHPVHWEAVSNIPGRAIILSTLFVLNSLLFFLKGKDSFYSQKRGRSFLYYVLSLIFFAGGLLSKESAGMLPMLILAYIFIIQKPKGRARYTSYGSVIPYFGLIVLYLTVRSIFDLGEMYTWRNAYEYFLGFSTFLRANLTYMRIFVLPFDMHFDRSQELLTTAKSAQMLGIYLFYFCALALIYHRRRQIPSAAWFFIAWYFIELFPTSQVVASIGVQPGVISAAEHFLYTASVAAFALMFLAVKKILKMNESSKRLSPQLMNTGIALFFAAIMLTTVQQSIYARDAVAMLKQSIRHQPNNARILGSLGIEYGELRMFPEAEHYFRRALNAQPNLALAQIGLAQALCDQRRFEECVREYDKIKTAGRLENLLHTNIMAAYRNYERDLVKRINDKSKNPKDYFKLGIVLVKNNKTQEATGLFKTAVEIDPDYKNALYNLASLLDGTKEYRQAAVYYERMLAIKSDAVELDRYAIGRLSEIKKLVAAKPPAAINTINDQTNNRQETP